MKKPNNTVAFELSADLSKRFGEIAITIGTQQVVYYGDFLALIGESGVGKSTLMNMMAGLLRPDAGKVAYITPKGQRHAWHGKNYSNRRLEPVRQHFNFVFQDALLISRLTTYENIALVPRLLGFTSEKATMQARIEGWLAKLGLDFGEVKGQFPHQLSGGKRRRIALVRALASDPNVIFVDEPTNGIDFDNSHKAMTLLREWLDEAPTQRLVIFVTHSPLEIMRYATLCLRMTQAEGLHPCPRAYLQQALAMTIAPVPTTGHEFSQWNHACHV